MKELGQITVGALLIIFLFSLVMILLVSFVIPVGMITGIEIGSHL